MSDFETIKAPERQVQWWRWPMMPFAAVIGASIGATLFTLLQWVGMKFQGGFSSDGWMYLYVLPVMSTSMFGYLYTWITCAVAPTAKFIAGVVMVTILGVLTVASITFFWLNPSYTAGRAFFETVRFLASIVMAVVALLEQRSKGI